MPEPRRLRARLDRLERALAGRAEVNLAVLLGEMFAADPEAHADPALRRMTTELEALFPPAPDENSLTWLLKRSASTAEGRRLLARMTARLQRLRRS